MTGALEKFEGLLERQADDIALAALDADHEASSLTLKSVTAGLVEGLPDRDVVFEFLASRAAHLDFTGDDLRKGFVPIGPTDRDARDDLMPGAHQLREEFDGMSFIARFAENEIAENDDGVRAENGAAGIGRGARGYREGFLPREPFSQGGRRLRDACLFLDVGRNDLEFDSGCGENLAPARGGTRKDQGRRRREFCSSG